MYTQNKNIEHDFFNDSLLKKAIYAERLEGLLMSIDGVRVSTEQGNGQVTSQSVTTDLKLLVQDEVTGELREVSVSFPGVVLPDSVGHEVTYQMTSGPRMEKNPLKFSVLPTLPTGVFVSKTLTDKDSGRTYFGNVETITVQETPQYVGRQYIGNVSGGSLESLKEFQEMRARGR